MLSGRCNVEQMEDRLTCYRHPGVEGLVSGGLLQLGRGLGRLLYPLISLASSDFSS